MQKVIDQITDQLVSLVTSNRAEYTPQELLKSGIPSFLVERIRLLLEDKVREEIGVPSALWFDDKTRLVTEAFQDYIRSAISTSRIPKEELYKVVHSVVKDIIFVFIEPRKKMAEYLFRDDEELSLEEVQERCSYLTIYKHFGTAIPLYMKKRNLDSLTKQRCKLLIQKLDTKLVASYTAQDWAQKLEQLFVLFGGKVHPMLLSTFFNDKGLYGMSGKFEGMGVAITKADFIKIISDEDLTGFVSEVIPTPAESKKKEEQPGIDSVNNIESLFTSYTETSEKQKPEKDTIAGHFLEMSLSDEEMSELLTDIASDGVVEVDDFEQVDSLNKLFSLSSESSNEHQVSETSEEIAAKIKQQKEDDTQEIAEFRENLISILDQAKNSFETIEKKDEPDEIEIEEDIADVFANEEEEIIDAAEQETIFEEDQIDNDGIPSSEEPEEKPMWAQFLNKDQMDVIMGGERSSKKDPVLAEEYEEEIQVDDTYSEEPVIEDQTKEEENSSFEIILDDRKAEFIEVIFSGSEKKYEKALEEIAGFSSWEETSIFIQNDIFKKNSVDLFSGATVDFTDRLHRYFNEKRNS